MAPDSPAPWLEARNRVVSEVPARNTQRGTVSALSSKSSAVLRQVKPCPNGAPSLESIQRSIRTTCVLRVSPISGVAALINSDGWWEFAIPRSRKGTAGAAARVGGGPEGRDRSAGMLDRAGASSPTAASALATTSAEKTRGIEEPPRVVQGPDDRECVAAPFRTQRNVAVFLEVPLRRSEHSERRRL